MVQPVGLVVRHPSPELGDRGHQHLVCVARVHELLEERIDSLVQHGHDLGVPVAVVAMGVEVCEHRDVDDADAIVLSGGFAVDNAERASIASMVFAAPFLAYVSTWPGYGPNVVRRRTWATSWDVVAAIAVDAMCRRGRWPGDLPAMVRGPDGRSRRPDKVKDS